MAEAAGLAASIAGLVGLSGQVLQGGLFIKQFFGDVRDAPVEVLDLRDELELFAFVVRDTEKLLQRASETRPSIDTTSFRRTLERCAQIVKDIGDRFVQCGENAGEDTRLWWKRLKVASRKKALADYMRRLERAKGQLLVVQSNLTQHFLLDQERHLQVTTESLSATSIILNNIHDQEIALAGQVEQLNTHFANGLIELSENLKHLQVTTTPFSTTQENSLADCGVDGSSIMGRNRVPSNVFHPSLLGGSGNYVRTSQVEGCRSTNSAAQKWRMVSYQRLNFWLVRVELKTRHQGRSNTHEGESHSESSEPPYAVQRSFHATFRVPFFHRNIHFQYQISPYPCPKGFDMQLRTHNFLPKDAPIFQACRSLDLPRVHELLQTKSASPFDLCSSAWGNVSLIEVVFLELYLCRGEVETKLAEGAALLKFLFSIFQDNTRNLNYYAIYPLLSRLMFTSDGEEVSPFIDIFRIILRHSDEDPFEIMGGGYTGQNITLRNLKSPISRFLVEQTYYDIDRVECYSYSWGNFVWENDRLMLADPEGLRMKAAIREGRKYTLDGIPWCSMCNRDAVLCLLAIAYRSETAALLVCCRNRLSFLVQELYSVKGGKDMLSPIGIHKWDGVVTVASIIQCVLQLNLRAFFTDVLFEAGWSGEAVSDIFEEELYAGVPELLDGKLRFHTQASQRRRFALDLIEGQFLDMSKEDIYELRLEYATYTGTHLWDLGDIILGAILAFRQKLTPGSWNGDGTIRLIPGVDFESSLRSIKGSYFSILSCCESTDLRDWLAYEDE